MQTTSTTGHYQNNAKQIHTFTSFQGALNSEVLNLITILTSNTCTVNKISFCMLLRWFVGDYSRNNQQHSEGLNLDVFISVVSAQQFISSLSIGRKISYSLVLVTTRNFGVVYCSLVMVSHTFFLV